MRSVYKIVITRNVREQLAHILRHLRQDLKNEQAARNVRDDMADIRLRLTHVEGNLKLCDHPRLRAMGYRTIHL